MNPQTPTQLDPRVLNLAKAIRQVESGGNYEAKGGSGEYGAFQYMPETWKANSRKWLGSENAPMTKDNQNAVTYLALKEYADKGYNPAQIAAAWNSGSPDGWEDKIGTNSKGVAYNVPLYVKRVTEEYQKIKGGSAQVQEPTITEMPVEPQVDTFGATFPATPGEGPLAAGAKGIGNLPSSIYNFGKGIVSAVANPIDTTTAIGNALIGGVNKLTGKNFGSVGNDPEAVAKSDATFEALATAMKDRYGSLENAQRTATNDPFGFGADVLSILEGGATLVGKGNTFNNLLSKSSRVVTTPVSKAGEIVKGTVSQAVNQATGAAGDTVSNIAKFPEEFSKAKMAENTRGALADDVADVLDKRIDDLSDTGRGYQDIRKAEGTVEIRPIVKVLDDGTTEVTTLESILEKNGIKLVDGKVKVSAESTPISPADRSSLQEFMDIYGDEQTLSPNALLNTRSKLSQMSKYEAGKTSDFQRIARDIRSYYDELGKEQIPGLKELDEVYAPEVTQLNQLKKDYLVKDPAGGYRFKDNAINKIANLTGKGKDQVLARLEEVMPGVTHRIKILKSVEDIRALSESKVGTYTRSGAVLLGASGNIPMAIVAILATPEIAVPIIRGLGITGKKLSVIVEALTKAANDTRIPLMSPSQGTYLSEYVNLLLNDISEDETQGSTTE